jgi:hypothetical protein
MKMRLNQTSHLIDHKIKEGTVRFPNLKVFLDKLDSGFQPLSTGQLHEPNDSSSIQT